MKIHHFLFVFISLLVSNSYAANEYKMGICNLDRTVESFDPNTWLSAKTRSSSDWIPIRFNNNIVYLGVGNNKDVYVNSKKNTKADTSYSLNYYMHSSGTSILLSSTNENTIIIFAKSEIGPFFLGTCELK